MQLVEIPEICTARNIVCARVFISQRKAREKIAFDGADSRAPQNWLRFMTVSKSVSEFRENFYSSANVRQRENERVMLIQGQIIKLHGDVMILMMK